MATIAETYVVLKAIHVGCVSVSATGFFARGLLMMADSPLLRKRWIRIAPHVVDTALLASAIGLAIILRQAPFVDGWLTAKFLGLLAYIGLGSVALRRGATRGVRVAAWLAALLVLAYIIAVALAHSPGAGLFAGSAAGTPLHAAVPGPVPAGRAATSS